MHSFICSFSCLTSKKKNASVLFCGLFFSFYWKEKLTRAETKSKKWSIKLKLLFRFFKTFFFFFLSSAQVFAFFPFKNRRGETRKEGKSNENAEEGKASGSFWRNFCWKVRRYSGRKKSSLVFFIWVLLFCLSMFVGKSSDKVVWWHYS